MDNSSYNRIYRRAWRVWFWQHYIQYRLQYVRTYIYNVCKYALPTLTIFNAKECRPIILLRIVGVFPIWAFIEIFLNFRVSVYTPLPSLYRFIAFSFNFPSTFQWWIFNQSLKQKRRMPYCTLLVYTFSIFF